MPRDLGGGGAVSCERGTPVVCPQARVVAPEGRRQGYLVGVVGAPSCHSAAIRTGRQGKAGCVHSLRAGRDVGAES